MCSFGLKAQNIQEIDSLMNKKKYDDALLRAYSFLYRDTISNHKSLYWRKIADIKFKKGEFTASIYPYQKTIEYEPNDSIKTELKLLLVYNYVVCKQYSQALTIINEDSSKFAKECYNKKYLFYKSLIHYQLGDFELSRQNLNQYFDNQKDKLIIDSLFSSLRYQDSKRDKLYKNLAYIPGVGQIAAGFYKSGINAILLNGLLVYAFVDVALEYHIIASLLTVEPWLQRYYLGGPVHVQHDILKRREKEKREIFQQILQNCSLFNKN